MDLQNVTDEELAVLALLSLDSSPAHLRKMMHADGATPLSCLKEKSPDYSSKLEEAAKRVRGWQSDGITQVHTFNSPTYPAQLFEVYNYPPVVFTRGSLPPGGFDQAVAIVGSRDAARWALKSAAWISRDGVKAGFTIASGLASGVDTAAHWAALDAGGRTVAVLGTGVDLCYPRANAGLQKRIETDGMLLSQFVPGSTPTRFSFPMRNEVMSAYSVGTIVVQASENSGTRHQVRTALKQGHAVVLSSQVACDTSWGRDLARESEKNGVRVADSVEEVIPLLKDAIGSNLINRQLFEKQLLAS